MDIASLGGLLLGVAMCILGIVTSGGVEAFGNFVDIPSVFVTIGGSLSSVLSSHKQVPDEYFKHYWNLLIANITDESNTQTYLYYL
jgi:chemotaxis protein MotA